MILTSIDWLVALNYSFQFATDCKVLLFRMNLSEKKMKYDTSYLNNFPIYYILLEEIDGNVHSFKKEFITTSV